MARQELNVNSFKTHERALLQIHINDLLPIFINSPKLRATDIFIEGGVGRGIFALLLIQSLCRELQLPSARYVGFDVLRWVSGGKSSLGSMTETQVKEMLDRQPSFSPHGVVIYHEQNKKHCISGIGHDIYPDNNVVYANCFLLRDVNRIVNALGCKNSVFVAYNASGALLDESRYEAYRWFDRELPYNAWVFLGHHRTPWKIKNPDSEDFLWHQEWKKIVEACNKARLTVHLLQHGIVATR